MHVAHAYCIAGGVDDDPLRPEPADLPHEQQRLHHRSGGQLNECVYSPIWSMRITDILFPPHNNAIIDPRRTVQRHKVSNSIVYFIVYVYLLDCAADVCV